MAQVLESDGVLVMEAMSANNTLGIASTTHLLVMLLGIPLLAAAFPARPRVVILKRKHPQ